MSDDSLIHAVRVAQQHPQLLEAVRAAYTDLQSELDTVRPKCDASGRCCRFETYGHRLYLSTAELALFDATPREPVAVLEENRQQGTGTSLPLLSRSSAQPWDGSGCPYQIDNLCTAREARPLGCRIYFCDTSTDAWQKDAYERFHSRLKQIHADFAVPYLYMEWRAALRELDLA